MDAKLMKDVMNAFAKLCEDAEKSEKKREERQEILKSYETCELKLYLSKKNMEQLGDLRRALGIVNAGKLRKHELIDALADVIPDRLEYIISNLFLEDVRLLEQVLAAGGRLEISDRSAAEKLIWWGIAGIDPKHMAIIAVIPSELREGIRGFIRKKALLKRIETMQQCYNIVKGMLFYYGIMELDLLPDIMKRASYTIEMDELIDYIGLNSNCGRGIDMQEFTISHQQVANPARIYMEQHTRKLPYAYISVEQALLAAKSEAAVWNEQDKVLRKLLVGKYKQSIPDAEKLVNKCIANIKNDVKFTEVVKYMSVEINLPDMAAVQELTGVLQNMYNHTPLWILRGHSPSEVRSQNVEMAAIKTTQVEQKRMEKVISKQIKELALNGNCIGYDEVFFNDTEVCLRTKSNALIYIDEQYCMKPTCNCNEAMISCVLVNESDNTGEGVLAFRYKLSTGKYEVEHQSCTNLMRKEILDAFRVAEKSLKELLKLHYQQMKTSGMKIFNEVEHTATAMPIKAEPSVGRNDPCPCGSGKKYKKCCGR